MEGAVAILDALTFGGGGFDFYKRMTASSTATVTIDNTYTHVDVTGKGFLVSLEDISGSANSRTWYIQVDGATSRMVVNQVAGESLTLLIPFKVSLRVTSNTATGGATACNVLLE